MKPSRQTQPYRSGVNRPPSEILDRMTAGKASPGTGKALTGALQGQKQRGPGKNKRVIPRW